MTWYSDAEYRPGDNKWAASVLALDPTSGRIKWGFQYTPNDPYDYDEISEHQIINAKVNGEDRKLLVHGARNGFYYVLDRISGAFVAGRQYVDELNWTRGLDPKTGRPLDYDPNKDVQTYVEGTSATRAKPTSFRCPHVTGGKNWEPAAYNPALNLIYIPSTEGCSEINGVTQADLEDQGGTHKWRDRFTGGGSNNRTQPTGSIKALDPVTGETTAIARPTCRTGRACSRPAAISSSAACGRAHSSPTTARRSRNYGASILDAASEPPRSATGSTASNTSPSPPARTGPAAPDRRR
jgi:alcohol dehydrogenase (cytochrome c)